MMRQGRTLWAAAAAVALAGAVRSAEPGFTRLFDGKNLDAFLLVGVTPATYSLEAGEIRCSGKPNGYFATKRSYRNYVLRFEWKYAKPEALERDADFGGNSGLLLHITGEHKVWPKCVEVQLFNRDAGNILGLSGGKARAKKDSVAQESAIRPVGQWNRVEVRSKDGEIVCRINGLVVCEASSEELREGQIGWQSEGAEVHFRNLEIRELP